MVFTLVPRLGLRTLSLLNIPHKDYWTRAENLPAAQQLLRAAELPRMPGSLFDALRSIPVAAPLDPPLTEHDPTRSVLGRSRRLLPRRNRLDH